MAEKELTDDIGFGLGELPYLESRDSNILNLFFSEIAMLVCLMYLGMLSIIFFKQIVITCVL